MASLYIYPEEGVPRKEELETACASIGRARDNDIVLADPACSSHHAFLDRGDRGYLIRDTGSKNGTLVNDRGIKGPVATDEKTTSFAESENLRETNRILQFEELIQAQKLKRELEVAADIWQGLLPRALPACEGFAMAARAVPCLQIGGDYYDLMSLEQGRIGLTVADVSGKGVGAALLMAWRNLRVAGIRTTTGRWSSSSVRNLQYNRVASHNNYRFFTVEVDVKD